MEPRRIHGGAMAGLVLLIVAVPPASVGMAVQHVADYRWEDVEREARARLSALQRMKEHRPVLRGEAVPGNAWFDYVKVWNLKWSDDFVVLDNYVDRKTELSREQAQALLEPYLPLLKTIQAGTHRAELLRMTPWNDSLPSLIGSRVITFGVCRARLLAEEGDVAGAVELLLDLMQYLGDMARLGRGLSRYMNLCYQDRILVELNSMLTAGLLDRSQLRQVVREMQFLERTMPSFGTMLRENAMFTALDVLRAKTVEDYIGESNAQKLKVPSWKFAFSQRFLLARYAELHYRLAERIAQGDGKSWVEARRRTADACAEVDAAHHPLHEYGGRVDWLPIQRTFLEHLAHFRMTRAAAEALAEGKVPELDDPFGEKLRWSKQGGTLKIWSVGWDGVDQGGHGGWSGKNSLDIVLEVRR